MIKITITDPLIASEAGEWCNSRFGDNWKLRAENMLTKYPTYEFGFEDSQNATMFSLRWAEYA